MLIGGITHETDALIPRAKADIEVDIQDSACRILPLPVHMGKRGECACGSKWPFVAWEPHRKSDGHI